METLKALDFFAGSGLVTEGLKGKFEVVWANDYSDKKADVYKANFGDDHLVIGKIQDVKGARLPEADLAWASFPCQDLSLAGNMKGMNTGERSALFWQWLRVMDEIPESRRPNTICVENVVGFLVADNGKHFKSAYQALRDRGYLAGALVVDAIKFVPQSRPRSFIVAVKEGVDVDDLTCSSSNHPCFTSSVLKAADAANDPSWLWWKLPNFNRTPKTFTEIVDFDAEVDSKVITDRLIGMLSDLNKRKLQEAIRSGSCLAGTGYKRIRIEDGVKKQRLEIRFDGVAGCLRTPEGGSSRQIVLIVQNGKVATRLLTIRETARLMGARETYKVPGSYNEAYRAMGDAVAVPVTRWLSENLLSPIAQRASNPAYA